MREKTVVVIGRSAGIGIAVVKLACEGGAKAIIGGGKQDRPVSATRELPGTQWLSVDLSNESQETAFLEQVGALDHLKKKWRA